MKNFQDFDFPFFLVFFSPPPAFSFSLGNSNLTAGTLSRNEGDSSFSSYSAISTFTAAPVVGRDLAPREIFVSCVVRLVLERGRWSVRALLRRSVKREGSCWEGGCRCVLDGGEEEDDVCAVSEWLTLLRLMGTEGGLLSCEYKMR